MLPLDEIRKFYPNASEEELKGIQEFICLLCCGLMQYFYGPDWEKDSDGSEWENYKG